MPLIPRDINDGNERTVLVEPEQLYRPARLAPLDHGGRANSPIFASVVCPAAVEQLWSPFLIVLHDNSLLEAYESDGFICFMSSRCPEVSTICPLDGATFVVGTADGFVMVLDATREGTVASTRPHDEAVTSVDYWDGHLVSVSRSKVLKVCRYIDGVILPVLSEAKLIDMPIAAKAVCINDVTRVLVAYRGSSRIEVYEVESLRYVESIDLQSRSNSPGGYGLVDFVLDETRTKFAAALDNKSSLQILAGFMIDLTHSHKCVVSSGEDVYSKSKIAWSCTGLAIWVLDDNGAISKVRLPDGRAFTKVVNSKDAITHMVPCYIRGREALVTSGADGISTRWM